MRCLIRDWQFFTNWQNPKLSPIFIKFGRKMDSHRILGFRRWRGQIGSLSRKGSPIFAIWYFCHFGPTFDENWHNPIFGLFLSDLANIEFLPLFGTSSLDTAYPYSARRGDLGPRVLSPVWTKIWRKLVVFQISAHFRNHWPNFDFHHISGL